MNRERVLKVVLVAGWTCSLRLSLSDGRALHGKHPALAMMLSVYVTLGIFLLIASRDPSANRSLIAFTAWSSFAHAALWGCRHGAILLRVGN